MSISIFPSHKFSMTLMLHKFQPSCYHFSYICILYGGSISSVFLKFNFSVKGHVKGHVIITLDVRLSGVTCPVCTMCPACTLSLSCILLACWAGEVQGTGRVHGKYERNAPLFFIKSFQFLKQNFSYSPRSVAILSA